MNNFKLIILDYPKLTLSQPTTQRVFSEMAISKQLNFERASTDYVSLNALDMISTHYLIYDFANPFAPKPVLAIRTCYENRARLHKLNLPIEDYIPLTPTEYQKKFYNFKHEINEPLVDCNAHFVDQNYSYSNTGLNLSEIAYFALIVFILRKGYGNWVGATNEKFKASRWAMKTGQCEDGLIFTHPKVEDPHKLLLVTNFNTAWLNECHKLYGHILKDAYEITPDLGNNSNLKYNEKLMSYDEIFSHLEFSISMPIIPNAVTASA